MFLLLGRLHIGIIEKKRKGRSGAGHPRRLERAGSISARLSTPLSLSSCPLRVLAVGSAAVSLPSSPFKKDFGDSLR